MLVNHVFVISNRLEIVVKDTSNDTAIRDISHDTAIRYVSHDPVLRDTYHNTTIKDTSMKFITDYNWYHYI